MDTSKASAGDRSDRERLEAVEGQQVQTAETVRALAATVKRLAVAIPPGATASPAARGATAEELVEWATWLVSRYDLDVPACWPLHGPVVEEFDALRVGWLATVGSDQGGMAAMQWHDGLERAIGRMTGRVRPCADGTHRDPRGVDWLTDGPTGAVRIDLAGARYGAGDETKASG